MENITKNDMADHCLKLLGISANKRRFPRRERRGLLSVLLTVAIVAIVVVAIIGIYNQVNTGVRATRITTTINSVESTARKLYYNAGAYPADMTIALIKAGAVAQSEIDGAGTARKIRSPYGEVTITSATPFEDFTVTVKDLPSTVCAKVGPSYLNNTSVKALKAGTGATTVTNVNDLLTECESGTAVNDLVIEFNG